MINERLREPLKLFIKELAGHLETLDKLELPDSEEALEQARKRLESKFHMIKGGAGFFSLKKVVELAAIGEDAMKQAKADAKLVGEFIQHKLKGILATLRDELVNLKEYE